MALTENAIKYVINHLFRVAWRDVMDEMSVDVAMDKLSAVVTVKGKKIVFKIFENPHIDQLIKGKANLFKVDTADGVCSIPVCLEEDLPFAEMRDNELHVHADIITLSFIMLSRYEEKIIDERDEFGRFESKNSIAVKYNFIDFPIVDEYALILQNYLKKIFPEEKIAIRECKIIPTHDIDDVQRFTGCKKTLRTILGDIYVYKNLPMFFISIKQYFASINNPAKDPYIEAIYELVKVSDKLNLKSEFYFMGAEPSRFACGYDIATSYVLNAISFIQQRRMVVGFHGGYETSTDSEQFVKEKKRIEAIIGNRIVSGRQHFLRFDVQSSIKVWDECGMQYDSTIGYADREGFRCGTCYEFHPYDFENDREYLVKERPLIVMDATLYDYRKYTIEEAYGQIETLYLRCKVVGGNFVILWHNNFVARETEWFIKVYCHFIKEHNNGTD